MWMVAYFIFVWPYSESSAKKEERKLGVASGDDERTTADFDQGAAVDSSILRFLGRPRGSLEVIP